MADELGPALLPLELDVRDRAAVQLVSSILPSEFADVDSLSITPDWPRDWDPHPRPTSTTGMR
jgi:3-hydroxy acid dehydrogenase/malonic semialdehyde reductase